MQSLLAALTLCCRRAAAGAASDCGTKLSPWCSRLPAAEAGLPPSNPHQQPGRAQMLPDSAAGPGVLMVRRCSRVGADRTTRGLHGIMAGLHGIIPGQVISTISRQANSLAQSYCPSKQLKIMPKPTKHMLPGHLHTLSPIRVCSQAQLTQVLGCSTSTPAAVAP